jgi:MtN3 and saliva related transmembrane protein
MSPAEYLGIFAGIFTTFAVVPQIMRVYKLKSAREISLIFTTSMLVGIVIWLAYGVVLKLYSIIAWNSIGIMLNSWLLFAKFKYGRVKNA